MKDPLSQNPRTLFVFEEFPQRLREVLMMKREEVIGPRDDG